MKRQDIQDTFKWNLSHIYASKTEWEQDIQEVETLLSQLKPLQGTFSSSASFLQCLNLDTDISMKLEKIYTYAGLKRDEDTTLSEPQSMADRANSLSVRVSAASSFIVPEILELDESTLESHYKETPELESYRNTLNKIIRTKAHILSKEQEEILSLTGEMAGNPSTIFNMLNNADIKFPVIKDENGNDIEVTKANYTELMDSFDQRVRKDAFQALYHTYMKYKNSIAAMLHAHIKKNVMYSKIQKYPSVLERSLFSDNVPSDVYNSLIQTVRKNLKPMHEYLELRKQILGLDELHMYDIYTPLVPSLDKKISYDEAYETMLEGLAPLGEEYVHTLQHAKSSGWIDIYENEGKRGGAYQWGPFGVHPYVLLNHKDNLDSMFTLAHEMGHAMHSYYSDQSNFYPEAQYTIFVAEVASTVNEVLLMHHLLSKTEDKTERMYLINHFLEQFRGTLYRQTMFAEFEKITHESVENGTPLTSDAFNQIYSDLNSAYYGENVVQDEEIQYEWMRIPHFYTSFYVYKYATGFSAAIAIAKRILSEGDQARDEYLSFLKTGGRDFPIELLKIAGVDMSTAKPVEDALSYFSELVEEFKSLI